MREKVKIFQEFMKEHWCYQCDADHGAGDCKNDNPKCIAFVFKYARRIDHWTPKKQGKKFDKFFSEWEYFIEGRK